MLDQQKNRMSTAGKKNHVVSQSSNDSLVKGTPIRNRYSTNSTVQQSMTPSKTLSMKPTIKSTLVHQNNKDPHSATHTTSSIRKSRVPLPSTPSSTRSSVVFQSSSQTVPSHPFRPSSTNLTISTTTTINKNHHPDHLKKIINTDEWEKNMDQVSKYMIDLLEACSTPKSSNLHIKIHQTTSSIRTLLSCIQLPSNQDYFYTIEEDTLSKQKKSVLHMLSKLLHTGSEVQLTGYDEELKFQTIVNQLWVELVAFEDIIHLKIKPLSNKKKQTLIQQQQQKFNILTAHNNKSTLTIPTTPPSSPPRDLLTPRSSTLEVDQLICSLINQQSQIIDLINNHIPHLNNNIKKDSHIAAIQTAKNTVSDAISQLIQVIRDETYTTLKENINKVKDTNEEQIQSVMANTITPQLSANNDNIVTKESNKKTLPFEVMEKGKISNNNNNNNVNNNSNNDVSKRQQEQVQSQNDIQQQQNIPYEKNEPLQKRSSAPIEMCYNNKINDNNNNSNNTICKMNDSTAVNKDSILSITSIESTLSTSTTSTSMSGGNNNNSNNNYSSSNNNNLNNRFSHPFEQLVRPSTSSNLLRKSSEFLRNTTRRNSNTNNLSNISSISSILSDDHTLNNDSSISTYSSIINPTPTISTSSSNRKLHKVTTLSNLAIRYLTSSTSSSIMPNRLSQQHQHQHQQHHYQQQSSIPPLSPIESVTTTTTTSNKNNNHTIPTSPNNKEPRLLNSKSTPTFDQIKRSTSQSLKSMGVASLKNISRKPRRFSNQHRKNENVNVSQIAQSPIVENSLNDAPLRVRLSTSFRLRRYTDADLHKKIIEEQKLIEEKENKPCLQVLVDTLTCHESPPDTLFLRTFFYNFRLFTEPKILAKMLIDRFNLKSPIHPETNEPLTTEEEELWESDVHVPIQLRVFFMIKNWFESYYDGNLDQEAAKMLLEFSKTDMTIDIRSHGKRLTELIELKLITPTESETVRRINNNCSIELSQENITISTSGILPIPSPTTSTPIRNVLRRALSNHNQHSMNNYHLHDLHNIHSNNNNNNTHSSSLSSATVSIHRMDPQEIANQLTLLESALFHQIPPYELMVTHKKKSPPALYVKAMVQQSTLMAYWISNTIIGEADAKIRVMVIKFWIKVADACLQLNNFNTLMTIRCALNSASIARLRKTWDSVMKSTKYKTMYNTINNVADSDRNFAVYRKCLKNAVAPGLPFLGIFLSDVIFIDEGNHDHRSSTATATSPNNNNTMLINYDKYMRMTQMLDQTIVRFQQVPYYKIKEIKEIQQYLIECIQAGNESNEELIYSKSLEIEPRIVEEVCV
ncbi:unnamed protein product [Cunninghamella blakesleeana]